MRNLILAVPVILFAACQSSNTSTPEKDPSLFTGHDTIQSVNNTTAPATNTTTITQGGNTNQPQQVQVQPQPMPQGSVQMTPQQQVAIQQAAAAQKTAAGMNPPHGQPGHRCDIAVGAPLNSPPGKNAPTSANITTTPATVNNTPTAPGMNPPHGQPGHRCDIPVGQPLNSKPTTPTVTTTQPTTNPVSVVTNPKPAADAAGAKPATPAVAAEVDPRAQKKE